MLARGELTTSAGGVYAPEELSRPDVFIKNSRQRVSRLYDIEMETGGATVGDASRLTHDDCESLCFMVRGSQRRGVISASARSAFRTR